MPQLSVVIITFNEEKNIARCLESVKDIADDIVVVDSFSTDKTEEICKRYNVNFIRHAWEGYSATKNFANSCAKYDLILSLDADEALSDELKASILKVKSSPLKPFCSFNRRTNYCGKWIYHSGWYPDKKLRIFDRTKAEWKGLIHEKIEVSSSQPVLHLKGDCLHYSYYKVEEHCQQAEKFSTHSAQAMFEKGKKVNSVEVIFKSTFKFFRNYFLKAGFLDGKEGFIISKMSAWETYLKYKKLRELNHHSSLQKEKEN